MKSVIGLITLGIASYVSTANAVVYCTGPGVPVGCIVRPVVVPGVVAPGVGAPGVGVVDPGMNQPGAVGNVGNPVNRGGPVNKPGAR